MVRKMKKILFVINQLGGGGAERVLTLLANRLSEENNVSILAIHRAKKKYEIFPQINVIELDGYEENTFQIIKAIRKKVKHLKPDTIVSFEYHMNMKVLLATFGIKNVRIIVSERNDPAQKGGKFGYKQLRNMLYKKSDCLVCQTPDAKAYFPKNIQKKTVIIPNPIKSDLPQSWEGTRRKEIVNFCRLNPQKNLRLLIDAFEDFSDTHPDFSLVIYGDGELHDSLQQCISEKGLENKVRLHPAVSDVHERIKDAYMFVSSSDFEGLSNSMLEAMAMGIPTICTDCPCGGARMVIENGVNGLLTPVGDKDKLSAAMQRVADNSQIAHNIGKEAQKIRSKLSTDIIVGEWRKII